MSAAAIVAIKRKRIIQKFRNANAFDEMTAINATEHNIRRSFIFKRLISQGIILPAGKDRYYLDAVREKEVTANRRRIILITMAVAIIVMLACFLFAGK